MDAQGKASVPSKTAYYDLLQVSRDVSEQDLKRAYRKRALRLHPDRGGDPEEFKCMKDAYDVLLDPKKRQIYDRYGEAAVKAMDGNVSSEMFIAILLNIDARDRALLILALTVVTGYLLLFPILLSIRWDHPKSMSFAQVFFPVWFALAGVLGCCLCVVRAPVSDPNEDDDEMRKQIEEMQLQTRTLQVRGILSVLVLFVLLLFLVLRLDGEVNWSYFAVIWPWFVLEAGIAFFKIYNADATFVMSGGNPEIVQQAGKWSTKDYIGHVISLMSSNFFHLIFACLVALKMDGNAMSWWVAFSPLWVSWTMSIIMNLSRYASVKSAAELESMSETDRAKAVTVESIISIFAGHLISLAFVVLFCMKLVHPTAFPAWIVFLPLFLAGCCFCSCISCCICVMGPPQAEDEGEASGAGLTGEQQGKTPTAGYGSV